MIIEECPYLRPQPDTVTTLPGLLYFIWEREVIRIVKERGGEKPYTKDPVLGKYKFTNIRRRDDRVSKWIIEHIIRPNEHRRDLWFILLITRHINWPPTLQYLIDDGILFRAAKDFDPAEFSRSVEEFKATGVKVYCGAYMIYPTKLDAGSVKSWSIAKNIFLPALGLSDKIDDVLFSKEPTISQFVEQLAKSFGISTFMCGQVAADLTYCRQLGVALDLNSYAPIGPGSSRGLNYLLNRAPNAGWTQENFNRELIKIRNMVMRELKIKDITLHDIQNCLCEYSKYCRAVLNEGSPKTTYQLQRSFNYGTCSAER